MDGVATTAHDAQQCVFGCSELTIGCNPSRNATNWPCNTCVPHPAPRMSETNQIDIHHHNYQTFGNHDRNAKRGHQYCVLGRPNRKESTAGANGTQIPKHAEQQARTKQQCRVQCMFNTQSRNWKHWKIEQQQQQHFSNIICCIRVIPQNGMVPRPSPDGMAPRICSKQLI